MWRDRPIRNAHNDTRCFEPGEGARKEKSSRTLRGCNTRRKRKRKEGCLQNPPSCRSICSVRATLKALPHGVTAAVHNALFIKILRGLEEREQKCHFFFKKKSEAVLRCVLLFFGRRVAPEAGILVDKRTRNVAQLVKSWSTRALSIGAWMCSGRGRHRGR